MSDQSHLSKRERQIMDVVYAHGEATVTTMLAEMPDPPMRAHCARCYRIKRVERKGYLSHRQDGREFDYRPTQPRGQAGRSALGRVLDVFFNGSLENAVAAASQRSAPCRKSSSLPMNFQYASPILSTRPRRRGRNHAAIILLLPRLCATGSHPCSSMPLQVRHSSFRGSRGSPLTCRPPLLFVTASACAVVSSGPGRSSPLHFPPGKFFLSPYAGRFIRTIVRSVALGIAFRFTRAAKRSRRRLVTPGPCLVVRTHRFANAPLPCPKPPSSSPAPSPQNRVALLGHVPPHASLSAASARPDPHSSPAISASPSCNAAAKEFPTAKPQHASLRSKGNSMCMAR